jgi:hypothetical protein
MSFYLEGNASARWDTFFGALADSFSYKYIINGLPHSQTDWSLVAEPDKYDKWCSTTC